MAAMSNETTTRGFRFAAALASAFALFPLFPMAGQAAEFTSDFRLESCTWSAHGRQNPYFSLRPGRQLVLEGEEGGATIHNEITMLTEVETIRFRTAGGVQLTIPARVVQERETADGELVEISRNWFSRCVETSDIFYFGEEVDIYEDGEVVSHDGAWRAGENGALPGIAMPGTVLLGSRYFQETAPGVAEDRAEHIGMGVRITVPAGTFQRCVAVEETNVLSPGSVGVKTYCPGVGLVKDDTMELVEVGVVP
jgi:hypothetical protein